MSPSVSGLGTSASRTASTPPGQGRIPGGASGLHRIGTPQPLGSAAMPNSTHAPGTSAAPGRSWWTRAYTPSQTFGSK